MGILDDIMGIRAKPAAEPLTAGKKITSRLSAKDDVYVSRLSLEKIASRLPETVTRGYNRPKATPQDLVADVFGREKGHFTGRQIKKIGKGLEEKGRMASSFQEKKTAEQQLDFLKRVKRNLNP